MEQRIIPISTYYTAQAALEKRFREKGRRDAFRAESREEYFIWREQLRKTLRELLGLDNMAPCPMHADMGDIGALLAPRPVMIQSCRADDLNGERGLQNAYEQVEIMRGAYRLFGKESLIFHDIREGGHCFHGDSLGEFFGMAQRNECGFGIAE